MYSHSNHGTSCLLEDSLPVVLLLFVPEPEVVPELVGVLSPPQPAKAASKAQVQVMIPTVRSPFCNLSFMLASSIALY